MVFLSQRSQQYGLEVTVQSNLRYNRVRVVFVVTLIIASSDLFMNSTPSFLKASHYNFSLFSNNTISFYNFNATKWMNSHQKHSMHLGKLGKDGSTVPFTKQQPFLYNLVSHRIYVYLRGIHLDQIHHTFIRNTDMRPYSKNCSAAFCAIFILKKSQSLVQYPSYYIKL